MNNAIKQEELGTAKRKQRILSSIRKKDALIIYTAFIKYVRKNGNTMKQCISCL